MKATVALLDGKIALVTGAGGGVGRAVAHALAREGARVVVNDLGCSREGEGASPEAADRVVSELRGLGYDAAASYDSVATIDGSRAMVDLAVERFGGIDVAVCCAGVTLERSALKTDVERFDLVMNTIARGTFLVAQAAARRMIDQKRGGRIVTVTAAAGLTGNLAQSAYAAANAAVVGLTRTLAVEWKKHHVTVNALLPTARTRMTDDLPMFATIGDDTLGAHFVAPAAVFLASSLAGELTGEVLATAGNKLSTWRARESHGLVGDDPRAPWTPEQIRARWFELSRA